MNNKKLTPKQSKFAHLVAKNGKKNATKWASDAGYLKNPEKWAEKLLKDKVIKAEIKKHTVVRVDRKDHSRELRQTGRPRLFNTVEEMQEKIDDFFATEDIITITGLALHLGFNSRDSLIRYQNDNEFYDTIKKAKLKVELEYEKRLIANGRGGDIFALKNFGWSDKVEVESKNENNNKLIIEVQSQSKANEVSKLIDDL